MPALPTVLARSAGGVVGVPNVQVTTPAISQGLAQLSGSFERLNQKWEKQAEQDGRLWAAKRSIELRSGVQRALQERLLSGGPVDGLGDWAATAADEAFRVAAEEAPNDYAKNYLALSGVDTRGDMLLSGDKAEADYKVTQRVTDAEDTLNAFMGDAALGGFDNAERLAGEWKATIEGMDGLPLETRAKMQRGTRDILAAAVRGQIEKNPGGAIEKTQQYMADGLIDAGDGAALISSAQNEIDRQAAKAEANAARADRLAAKALAETQDETAKTGYEMIASGKVDADWIINNKANLSPSDYRIMLGALNDPTDQKDVVARHLRSLYIDGDMDPEAVIQDVEAGVLSAERAKTLLDENQSLTADDQPLSPLRTGRELLTNQFEAFKGVDGGLAASAFAFAKADFEQWARDNPDATEVEIRSQAELLASRAGADVYSKARDKMKRPAFLVGTKDAPDIEKTKAATMDAFIARHGGDRKAILEDPEYLKEMELILELERLQSVKPSGATK